MSSNPSVEPLADPSAIMASASGLQVRALVAGYGRLAILHGLDLAVAPGTVHAVLGANGAGKTTLLRALMGAAKIFSGEVLVDERNVTGWRPARAVAGGMALVPEGRRVFPGQSIEVNLRLGAWARRQRNLDAELAAVYSMFPMLADRRHHPAGSLSGGQQQMLAIGMGLMARPRLLLLDEPSLGLAPTVVAQVFETIAGLRRDGLTVVVVEQLAEAALGVADTASVLRLGRVVAAGDAASLRADPALRAAYLGSASA